MCHHCVHSNCKNHATQVKSLPSYWPLRALKNVLLLNLWKPKCQTNFWSNWCMFRGLACEMLFCISSKRQDLFYLELLSSMSQQQCLPCVFQAFMVVFFAFSAPQNVSSLWRMRWTALVRSRSTQAKGALQAVAASPVDGMKWSQVSPGSQSPRTSSPLALFRYQNCCLREVTSSRRLVTSEKRPNENMAVVLLLLQLWMFL